MLARRPRRFIRFTRRDAVRLLIAATVLVAGMTAILSIEIVPAPFRAVRGGIADRDIVAPRSVTYVSDIATQQASEQASNDVGPQYDFTTQKGEQTAERQGELFDTDMGPIDAAFAASDRCTPRDARRWPRHCPNLSGSSLATLQDLTAVAVDQPAHRDGARPRLRAAQRGARQLPRRLAGATDHQVRARASRPTSARWRPRSSRRSWSPTRRTTRT